MRKPFELTKEQVLNLPRWDIFNLYFRARDKDGNLKMKAIKVPKEEMTTKEYFYYQWEFLRNLSKDVVDQMWREEGNRGRSGKTIPGG